MPNASRGHEARFSFIFKIFYKKSWGLFANPRHYNYICNMNNKRHNSIWLIKETGEIFKTRKEIKEYLGEYKFRKMQKKGKVLYISPELVDEMAMLKNGTASR